MHKKNPLHLQFQAVVFHFEIHPRRSNIEGDPLSPVERHLESEAESPRSHDLGGFQQGSKTFEVRATDHGVLAAGQRREGEGAVILR